MILPSFTQCEDIAFLQEILGQVPKEVREQPEVEETLCVAGLVEGSTVDGPGFRLTVFGQGCPHRCPGCHNPQTHAFSGGTDTAVSEILGRLSQDPLSAGLTLSGGEPFSQANGFAVLAKAAKSMGYSVITYTGYELSELLIRAKKKEAVLSLLQATDLLVDGPFVQSLRSLSHPYRGSTNQKLWLTRARLAPQAPVNKK